MARLTPAIGGPALGPDPPGVIAAGLGRTGPTARPDHGADANPASGAHLAVTGTGTGAFVAACSTAAASGGLSQA